jgi:SM-20-related protein
LTVAAQPGPALHERVPPHALRSGFLGDGERAELLEWTLAHEGEFVPSKIRAGEVRPQMRNSLTLRQTLLKEWRPRFRERIAVLLPGLYAELGIAPFEMGRIEVQLLAYGDGAYYRRHRDIARRGDRPGMRVMSAVFYFHSEPKRFEGGELRLHAVAVDTGAFLDIAPWQNGLVAFPSWAPHEVRPVGCPSGRFADARFAVNMWIHLAEPEQ